MMRNSWPTGQENESEEQPEGNDKEEFGNSWGVDEENEIDEQQQENNDEEKRQL